jgi:hypothetical protein
MAAYGGYVAAQPADLSGIISNFGNKAIAIKEAAKERQEKQDLIEQQKAERIQARDEERAYREQQDVIKGAEESTLAGIKEISDVTADTGQQTYEGLATEATSAVADAIHNIGKDIKSKTLNPLEGRVAQQKLVKSFKDFAAGKENFAKGLAFLKEKAPKQSELGKALGAAYFGMGDMPYKTYEITPDKGLILYDKDPKTKKAVPGSAIPTTAFANYQAYEDEEVDYNKQMNDFAVAARTSFAPSGPLAQKKITSEEKNEGYATQRDLYAKQILPSNKDVARYLTQVDGYGIIVQGKQVKQPDKGKPSITLEMTSAGIYEPVVTDTMKTNALESVKAGIDARAKESQQVSRNPNIIVNTGGVGTKEVKLNATDKKMIAADKLANATVSDIQNGNASSANIKNFILGLASEYDVDPRKSRLMKMPDGSFGIQIISTTGVPNVNFGNQGIITSYDEIVPLVPEGQINRVLISDQSKSNKSVKSTKSVKKGKYD